VKAGRSRSSQNRPAASEVDKAIVDAVLQGKNKTEVIELLVKLGLPEDEAERCASRMFSD
jgi:hypothetical protein